MLRTARSGFSLVEIMVVVAIMGLLAAAVAVNVMRSFDKAKVERAKSDIAALETAMDLYKLDNGNYPSSGEGIKALTGGNKKYLKREIPNDPWGNPYVYVFPGSHGEYDIESYGADASDGGEDDVESWNLEKAAK